MVKKSNMEPVTEVNIVVNSAPAIQTIRLEIGLWKQLFVDEQNKLMIAKALNYCVYKGLHIAGYLITENNVYLVLRIDTESLIRMLNMFDDTLRKEIKQHQEYIRNHANHHRSDDRFKTGESFIGLFVKHRLYNYKLIQLITGQPVDIPYHDPHLVWLKKRLRSSDFCSVIDYSGAKGPVEISRI
jgi:hypothetical protein